MTSFDNVYYYSTYDEALTHYPSLAMILSRDEFEKNKESTTIVNRIYYYVYIEIIKNGYITGITKRDDFNKTLNFDEVVTFNSLHEVKAYIDACIDEDLTDESIENKRVIVVSNRLYIENQETTKDRMKTIIQDKYTFYLRNDIRHFNDIECYEMINDLIEKEQEHD